MAFHNPTDEEIKTLLKQIRTIAVVGLSPRLNRPSHRVASALQRFGYRIIPVRPAVDEVLGERAYPGLRELPVKPDLVDVFRAPEQVGPIVDDSIALGVSALWLQEGVVNEEAAQRARDAGMRVVMDRCLYREYVRFFGDRSLSSIR